MGSEKIMNIKKFIPEPIKQIFKPIYYKIKEVPQKVDLDPRWIAVQKKLSGSKKIITFL